jgi:hypothetical protein
MCARPSTVLLLFARRLATGDDSEAISFFMKWVTMTIKKRHRSAAGTYAAPALLTYPREYAKPASCCTVHAMSRRVDDTRRLGGRNKYYMGGRVAIALIGTFITLTKERPFYRTPPISALGDTELTEVIASVEAERGLAVFNVFVLPDFPRGS